MGIGRTGASQAMYKFGSDLFGFKQLLRKQDLCLVCSMRFHTLQICSN